MSEAHSRGAGGSGGRSAPGPRGSSSQIEGRRPVTEALRAGREVTEVVAQRGARGLGDIVAAAERAGVAVRWVSKDDIARLAHTRAPQGVVAVVGGFRYATVDSLLQRKDEPALLVALDHVTDPQNVGAIARSAEAFGCHGLVLPGRRAASVGPAAEKAAAGALTHLAVARVGNLARALDDLKEKGIWIVALDETGQGAVDAIAVAADPMCLVVGAEGAGVSRLVRERADHVVRIPTSGRISSLNASAAAAVALFEIRRQRGGKGV